jgi:hypothetical protein
MPDTLQSLLNKIQGALKNLVTLEIVTAVGHVRFKRKPGPAESGEWDSPDLDDEQDYKAILTRIDLLQGDIKTVFHEEFVTGQYQSLRDFHAAREDKGHQIVRDNIEAIKDLVAMIKGFI